MECYPHYLFTWLICTRCIWESLPTSCLGYPEMSLKVGSGAARQLALDTPEPHWHGFPLFYSSRASFECSASSDGFIMLPLLLPCLVFPLSSTPPRGIAMHTPDVDCGTEKPVDDCLHGNGEEYVHVHERELELFSLLFVFSLPFFYLWLWCYCFFVCLFVFLFLQYSSYYNASIIL